MNNIYKISIILGLLTVLTVSTNSANAQVIDPRYESIFIYQFTKYIEWPQSTNESQEFVIGVIGKGAILEELKKMSESKTVNGKSIVIKQLTNPAQAKSCNILFISKPYSSEILDAVDELKGESVLVITETNGGAYKGAGVNFILVNNRIKFEINKASTEQANLKVRSSLLKLAKVVG